MRIVHLLLASSALVIMKTAVAGTSWDNPPKRADRSIQHGTFPSAALRTRVGYNICLPPQYASDPKARFPVVYYLHGYEGNESSFLEYARYWKAALPRTGPMILVFVNGGETSFFSDSADRQMPGETVLVKELLPHIDSQYRTRADASGRSLHGYSMGGFGALKLAFKYPSMFGSVVAYGATLADAAEFRKHLGKVYRQMFDGDPRRYADSDPLALAERHADLIRGRIGINIIIGSKDDFLPRNRALRDRLQQLSVPVTYQEIRGAGHKKDDLYEPAAASAFEFSAQQFKPASKATASLDKR
jgi:enterochelin esterase-like enzyme